MRCMPEGEEAYEVVGGRLSITSRYHRTGDRASGEATGKVTEGAHGA